MSEKPPGFALAASEWNEAVAGRPFTVTDWGKLTFGEQRTYAELALGNTASPGSACSGDADTGEGRG